MAEAWKATEAEEKWADELVQHCLANAHLTSGFMNQVLGYINESRALDALVHTILSRPKDPEKLKRKLLRKLKDAQKENAEVGINKDNVLVRVNDLVGIRLLHLYTLQFEAIHKALMEIFHEQQLALAEAPFARTWDNEYRDYFRKVGIETQDSETMYTSVHYVVTSGSRTPVTCEIQVRTLMEEVWGEVDHTINYPEPIDSVACREQLRALARATSSATRLVDAIFATVADLETKKKP